MKVFRDPEGTPVRCQHCFKSTGLKVNEFKTKDGELLGALHECTRCSNAVAFYDTEYNEYCSSYHNDYWNIFKPVLIILSVIAIVSFAIDSLFGNIIP